MTIVIESSNRELVEFSIDRLDYNTYRNQERREIQVCWRSTSSAATLQLVDKYLRGELIAESDVDAFIDALDFLLLVHTHISYPFDSNLH